MALAASATPAAGSSEHDRRHIGVDGRAAGEQELLGAGRSLQAEEVLASHLGGEHDGELHQRDETLVPPRAVGAGVEHGPGVGVLAGDPVADVGVVTVLEPAVRVGDLDAVDDVDDLLTPGGRRRHDVERARAIQPRPTFGRLPWLAFERRMRALRFLVFFDIAGAAYGVRPPLRQVVAGRLRAVSAA